MDIGSWIILAYVIGMTILMYGTIFLIVEVFYNQKYKTRNQKREALWDVLIADCRGDVLDDTQQRLLDEFNKTRHP